MQTEKISATEWRVTGDDGIARRVFMRAGATAAEVLAAVAEAGTPETSPEQKQAEMQAAAVAAVDAMVERTARERGYKSAAQLAGYATSTVPRWQSEAQVFVAWRDRVWLAAHALLDGRDGDTEPPGPAAVTAALPAMTWPVG